MADDAAELDSEYGKRLKGLRENTGMTQAEVVDRLRAEGVRYMNASTLSRIESGARAVRLSEAEAFSRIYRFPLSMLTARGTVFRLLESANRDHREARRKYVQFRDLVADLAEIQTTMPGRIRGMEILREEVSDEDTRREIDMLIKNLHHFGEMDLPGEVAEFSRLSRERYNEAAKSPAGRFLNQRQYDRVQGEHER
jgi:transcriptional regulator with XRE-family HTH domain